MATYKSTKGWNIQTIAGDPSDPIAGQVWYNTTSNVLKGYASVAGSWASGGDRNTRTQGNPGVGSQTAAFTAGGVTESPGVLTKNSETYNGTAWTELADLATAVYNGSGAGTLTSALNFGGTTPVAPTATTSVWDGTSWSEGTNLPAACVGMCECIGTSSTSAISAGAGTIPLEAKTLSYNGTSWTELNDVNTGRSNTSGNGTATAALMFGGSENPPLQDATEEWNGTSWTEVGVLATVRAQCGGSGTASAALCFGGIVSGPPTIMNTTEAWNSGLSVVTFTSS